MEEEGGQRHYQPWGRGPWAGPGHPDLTAGHWLRSAASPVTSPSPIPRRLGGMPPVSCVSLITTISPKTSSRLGNPNSAALAQAAFILQAHKVFRSFSLQRPCFLSHYLPHRQPSLPQKQDFFFLSVIFVVPFIYRWLFFSWLWLLFKRAGKQREEGSMIGRESLISPKMFPQTVPRAAACTPVCLGPHLAAPAPFGNGSRSTSVEKSHWQSGRTKYDSGRDPDTWSSQC